MTEASVQWLVVAHLVRPQGRKGELLAELLTEFPERFGNHARVFLAPPGFGGPGEETRSATVISFWLPKGKQQGRIVLGFDISQTISEAERLVGLDVLVPLAERRPLQDDAVYVHDLIGCDVFDRSELVGTIRDVLSISGSPLQADTPDAAPVLVVVSEKSVEYLIPFARAYLRSVDLELRRVTMELPEALLDLYETHQPDQPPGGPDQNR